MPRRTQRQHASDAPRGRVRAGWVLALGTVATGAAMTLSAHAAAPLPYAAEASVSTGPYYLADTAGSLYTFTVRNTGTTTPIGAVEVSRPLTGWTVTGCPSAPAGWSASASSGKCRYRSASGSAGDIAPGASRTFGLTARTDGGTADRSGTWLVVVSSSSQFDNPSLLQTASAAGSGLTTLLHSFEITTAVVGDGAPGGACPPAADEAISGSTQTIVVCGRNRASAALTPVAGHSSLGGTFLASPGTFSSALIPKNSGVVVLARWTGATVTSNGGPGKTIVAKVGAATNRTSPLTTLSGYTAINNPPTAGADAYSAVEDVTLTVAAPGVLANDTDPDGDALTATHASDPAHGTVTLNADGSFSYLADPHFHGTDSFTYRATDPFGASDSATVTITVAPVADAPEAGDDTASTGENAATAIPVLGNDADADGDALTVTAVHPGGIPGTVTNHGSYVSYDPGTAFDGLRDGDWATVTFTYTVSDGTLTDVAEVVVTVTGANDAPSAVDDTASTGEGTPAVLSVLANDTDAENDALTITTFSAPTAGVLTSNGDGTLTFDPAGDFEDLGTGESRAATFTYTVSDPSGATGTATVTVTVTGANDAPVANADTATAGEDAPVSVPVLGNDTDADGDPLHVSATDTTGVLGTVTRHSTHVVYDPNGAFEYLAAGETATETFGYTASDGAASDDARVTVTVAGANDAPVAAADAYSTLSDTALTVAAPGVLTNDTDADASDTRTAANASDPAHGSVTLRADGSFDYTPDAGFTGTDTFTYDVTDGPATDTATVTLTVIPPNAVPTAEATSASGNEDGGAITVTLTGRDGDGDALTFDVGTATNGLVTVPGSVNCDTATPSTCTATVTYTPNANFHGSDAFTYTVHDGTVASAPATASITVRAVNDAPSFTKGANQTTTEDGGAQTVAGWATAISAGPANESGQTVSFVVTTSNDALFGTLPAVAPDGTLTYAPGADRSGSATVSVTAVDDGGTANGGVDRSAAQTFTVTVTGSNDAPVAADDSPATSEDAVASINVVANDVDVDGDALTVSGVVNTDADAVDGVLTVNPDQTVRYDPRGRFDHLQVGRSETDTFTYTVTDPSGASDTATVTVTVTGVNDAPTATPKSHTALGNTLLAVGGSAPSAPHTATSANHLLVGVTDPDDTSFTASAGTGSTNGGTVAAAGDGSFTYLPPQGYTGTDTFSFTVSDGNGGSDSDTVTVSISEMVWYVDAAAGTGGTGRSSEPFANVAPLTTGGAADAKDGAGDHLFLFEGAYTGGLVLEPNQKLWGEPNGFSVAGTPLVAAGGLNPRIANASGDAIVLANGADVQRVDAGASSGAGLRGTSLGNATVGSNTTIGDAVALTGPATGTVTIGSDVTNAGGTAVTVANRTGGTVTLSGDVTGGGVLLQNNTGSAVALTGTLALTSGAADAFVATGGGTVTAPDAANTVSTTTGRGVVVQNTTIGAADLVFRSVSVNGAPSGIVLASTGSTGSLVVNGTGGGGTIANTTGPGVSLASTRDVSLTNLTVRDTGNDGLSANGVTNLSLTGVRVLGAGDADEERALDLTEVGGTIAISGGTYDDASDDLVKLVNQTATATLNVSGGATFSNQTQPNAGNAIELVPNVSAGITATIDGSTFGNLRGPSVTMGAAYFTSNGTSSLTFTNNTVNGGTAGGGSVVVNGQESTRTTLTVTGNTFTGAGGDGVVSQQANDSSVLRATVRNNTFTAPRSHAVVGTVDEDGDAFVRVDGNTISNAGGDGIQLTNFGDDSAAAQTSTAHFVVTGNTVTGHSGAPASAFVGGIAIFQRENDADTTCARVSGNTVSGTPAGFYDVFLQDDSAARLLVEESPDTSASGAVSASYLHSLNPGTTLANIDNTGAVYSNGVTCQLP